MANVRLNWNGPQVTQAIRREALKAMADGAEFILQESNKIVPHDEGILQASGDIDMGMENGQPTANVFYDTPYAVRVHEHPEYNFQGGREGKYLEKTFNREIQTVRNYIEDRMRRLLR